MPVWTRKKITRRDTLQAFAQHGERLGEKTPRMEDACFSAFCGPSAIFCSGKHANGSGLRIAAFAAQVEKLPGAQSRIQGEQNHVVDLHGLPTSPPVTKQLRDLCIAQDAESAAVHFGEHDSAIAAAQNRRIRAAEQHDAWSAWGWRLQCVIVDLPNGFEDVQNRLGRKPGCGIVFIPSRKRPLGSDNSAKISHVLRRDLSCETISKDGQDMSCQQLDDLGMTGTMRLSPHGVMLCQLSEGQIGYLCSTGKLGLALLLLLSHGSHLAQALRTLSCADIFLQLAQQGDGFGDRPAFAGPAQRLMDTLALSNPVTDREATVRSTAMLPRGMLAIQHPLFPRQRMPSLFVTHLSPTFLDSMGSYGYLLSPARLENQGDKCLKALMGTTVSILLSSWPGVRILPGAPWNDQVATCMTACSHLFFIMHGRNRHFSVTDFQKLLVGQSPSQADGRDKKNQAGTLVLVS